MDFKDELSKYELRCYNSQFYLIKANTNKTTVKREIVMRLIEIDVEMNGKIDDIVSCSWKELSTIDDGKFLDKIQDTFPTPYNKASKLIRHQLGDSFRGWTYKKLRSFNWVGYSDYYFWT